MTVNTPRRSLTGVLALLLAAGVALLTGGTGFASSSHTGAVPRWIATDLGDLGSPESSAAYDINNRGQVVGVSRTKLGITRAFLWQDGVMAPLGKSGYSSAWAINDRGQVIGIGGSDGNKIGAVMRDHGRVRQIGGRGTLGVSLEQQGRCACSRRDWAVSLERRETS